jgi:LDH2 family malate/lactate/ureidoglycolate dehydrogenase
METHCFQASYLHAITRQLFMAAGAPRDIADEVAEILVKANLTGHDSHGVLRVPAYLRGIAANNLDPAAKPAILRETPNLLFVDGQNGFGHYTAKQAMAWAIEKARQTEVCCVSFINTGHIGRLGEYAEQAAQAGCIGLITFGVGGRDGNGVAPFGGISGALKTNPLAVGVPTGDEIPFVLDFATSVVAEGKLQVARSKKAMLPEGYIINKHGQPSTNPADYYDGGFLLPFGGHKGYALGILMALLGGLSGNFDSETGSVKGEFMQVINIEAFTPLEAYQRGVRALLNDIKTTPPAAGFAEVLAPGEFEQRSRLKRLVEGIEIPATIYSELQEWADRLAVSLSDEMVEAADRERYNLA